MISIRCYYKGLLILPWNQENVLKFYFTFKPKQMLLQKLFVLITKMFALSRSNSINLFLRFFVLTKGLFYQLSLEYLKNNVYKNGNVNLIEQIMI